MGEGPLDDLATETHEMATAMAVLPPTIGVNRVALLGLALPILSATTGLGDVAAPSPSRSASITILL